MCKNNWFETYFLSTGCSLSDCDLFFFSRVLNNSSRKWILYHSLTHVVVHLSLPISSTKFWFTNFKLSMIIDKAPHFAHCKYEWGKIRFSKIIIIWFIYVMYYLKEDMIDNTKHFLILILSINIIFFISYELKKSDPIHTVIFY